MLSIALLTANSVFSMPSAKPSAVKEPSSSNTLDGLWMSSASCTIDATESASHRAAAIASSARS